MNNDRRKQIQNVQTGIDELRALLESIRDEEQEAFDNMPENMQQSERGEKAEAAIEALESAVQSCEEVESYLVTAVE